MPNIEIHGLGGLLTEQAEIRFEIKKRLSGAAYAKEVVITETNDRTHDLGGKLQPFLRVIVEIPDTASIDKLEDIKDRLKGINADMEILYIGKFIPKEEPKKKQ